MAKKAPAKKSTLKKRSRKPAAKKPATRKSAPPIVIPAKGALVATIAHASHIQFTANSKAMLVSRLKKKAITLFDLESQTETPPLPALPTYSAIALSPDSRFIAMGTSTGILAVQSTQTGKIVWKSKADGKAIGTVAFALDGVLLFAAAPAPEGHIPETPAAPGATPKPDPKHDQWIRVHKAATGEVEIAFAPIAGALCCHLALSPDGKFLAHSELHSNSVLIWHLPTRQMGACIRLPRNRGPIRSLAFGLTVRHLFLAQQAQITGWNAENGTQILQLDTTGAQSLAAIDHGDTLAVTRAAADEQSLQLLKADTGFVRRTITLAVKEAGPLSASPDGVLLALPTAGDCYVWQSARLLG